jgi:hypothetical protein
VAVKSICRRALDSAVDAGPERAGAVVEGGGADRDGFGGECADDAEAEFVPEGSLGNVRVMSVLM